MLKIIDVSSQGSNLSLNQKYDLLRKCVICFFDKNRDKLDLFGYCMDDFVPTMKFVKELYYNYSIYEKGDL